MNKSKFTIEQIALIGVFGALVYVATYFLRVPLPAIVGTKTMIHMGNVMCILSGLVLGPIPGGLAAGIGSGLFDLTTDYVTSAPFTLVFKFLMAFVCGKIAFAKGKRGLDYRFDIVGAAAGMLTYIVLYLGKTFIDNHFFLQVELQTNFIAIAQKAGVSLVNALLAVIIGAPLGLALNHALGGLRKTK